MESISVYNIPVIGVRAISNNEVLGEEYDRTFGIQAQKFTEDLIKII